MKNMQISQNVGTHYRFSESFLITFIHLKRFKHLCLAICLIAMDIHPFEYFKNVIIFNIRNGRKYST